MSRITVVVWPLSLSCCAALPIVATRVGLRLTVAGGPTSVDGRAILLMRLYGIILGWVWLGRIRCELDFNGMHTISVTVFFTPRECSA